MHVHIKPFIPAPEMQSLPKPRPARSSATGAASDAYAVAALTPDRGGSGSRSRPQRPPRQVVEPDEDAAAPNQATRGLALLLAKLDLDALG